MMKIQKKLDGTLDPESVKNEAMKDIARGLGLKTPQGRVPARKNREKLLIERLGKGGYVAMSALVESFVQLSNTNSEAIRDEKRKAQKTRTIKIPKGSRITLIIESE